MLSIFCYAKFLGCNSTAQSCHMPIDYCARINSLEFPATDSDILAKHLKKQSSSHWVFTFSNRLSELASKSLTLQRGKRSSKKSLMKKQNESFDSGFGLAWKTWKMSVSEKADPVSFEMIFTLLKLFDFANPSCHL